MLKTSILLYILLLCCGMVFLGFVVKLFRLKIWVYVRNKKRRLDNVGYLKMSNNSGEAAEVYLSGGGTKYPIGRIILDEDGERGDVEVLASDFEDDPENLKFRYCGFVDTDGFIYKQPFKNKRPERIGYLARPSHPDVPTIYGERTWKSLWMVKTLHAYMGNPPVSELPDAENHAPVESHIEHWVINNPVNSDAPQEEPLTSQEPIEETPADKPSQTAPTTPPPSTPEPISETEPVMQDENKAEERPKKSKKAAKGFKKSSKKNHKKKKEPIAVCSQRGLRSTRRNPIPAEARACAFAVFFNSCKKKKYSEYYRNHPYGWRDTALLTTLIYAVLFIVLYAFSVGWLGKPLLGDNIRAVSILVGFYYVLWAVVRRIKIASIENSNTIQPKLDLFNKVLGHRVLDVIIIVLSGVAMSLTLFYYDYDFIPLIWGIGFGTAVNFSIKKNRQSWKVLSTFRDEDEESDAGEVRLPDGDISRTYEWELDSLNFNKENRPRGNMTLYFSAEEMADIRKMNPFFAQRSERSYKEYIIEMFQFMKEHPTFLARSIYVKNYILNTAKTHLFQNELDIIQFTLDFVQEPNIKFSLNRDSKSIDQFHDYIRFPDETLYDKEGDCNSKSLLAAVLFYLMGHNVLYMYSRKQEHSAIGIELTEQLMERISVDSIEMVEYNRKKYIFCETTGDTFKAGQTMDGMFLDDFEDKIELLYQDDEDDADTPMATTVTKIYNWELDSVVNNQNKLRGNLAIEFNMDDVRELREINPFRGYGVDGNTYEQNIRNIFAYVFDDIENYKRVKQVTDYIRDSVQKAKLPELDLLQFALDFAQEPNIHYCKDEDSSSIGFPKEYMRFPDEVLFDKEGDCDCKSSLTCALFHQLGYNVIFMLGATIGHAAVGVELKEEWLEIVKPEKPETVVREYNGRKYIYCETTGDGNKIGYTKEGQSIQDFETIVEFPA